MTEIYVKVEPDAENFAIEQNDFLEVKLENPAEKGLANAELTEKLAEILDRKVAIVSGHNSARKKIAVDLPQEEIERKMRGYLDG